SPGAPGSGPGAPPPPGEPPKEVVCASASPAPARRGPRTGPRSTGTLLAALAERRALGYSPEETLVLGMGQFPVAGPAHYTDDWLDPRSNPCPHLHMGTDIFAARGTPVRAPVDGVVRFASESVGGLSAYVRGPDGTIYYMTHLDRFPTDIGSGAAVRRGQTVGFVGNTGNAAGGAHHVHFQLHPGGGAPVNPKPFLDRWLDEAIAAVPTALPDRHAEEVAGMPWSLVAVGELRRFDTTWAAATADPVAARAQEWEEATALARAYLEPLGPTSLETLLAPGD
ncbi:MAG TPA: M23 family metallopeptidase, partial [Acidimicrobiales bacterium]|nr:M23 family metallopeptidase [Acidimicrobiales bacterium]